jgi:CRISPR-associated protein Cas8a1/Csx13
MSDDVVTEAPVKRGAREKKAASAGAKGKSSAKKPSVPTELVIELSAPGMTNILAAGVGGLAASLRAIARREGASDASWPGTIAVGKGSATVEPRRVTLRWPAGEHAAFFAALCAESFRINAEGMIDLPGIWPDEGPPRLAVRSMLQDALRLTFLQHGSAAKREGAPVVRSCEIDGQPSMVLVQRYSSFNHQSGPELIVSALERGSVTAAGWLHPGAITRHEGFKSQTECGYTAAEVVAGLFALVGAVSLRYGDRPFGVLLVPVPSDLVHFAEHRGKLTPRSLQDVSAASMGDAALRAWIEQLRSTTGRGERGRWIRSVSAMALKALPWADKQKSRFHTVEVPEIERGLLTRLDRAMGTLPARVQLLTKITEKDARSAFWIRTSELRGFVCDNIAGGRRWYAGFATARTQDDPPRYLHRFRGMGRNDLGALRREEVQGMEVMVNDELDPTERKLVEAIHESMRRAFREIAQQNEGNTTGMRNRMERQRERWRLDFANAKTHGQVRSAVSALVGRALVNTVLQESWPAVLGLVNDGSRWEIVRDLGLVALVSYRGRKKEEGGEDAPEAEVVEAADGVDTSAVNG